MNETDGKTCVDIFSRIVFTVRHAHDVRTRGDATAARHARVRAAADATDDFGAQDCAGNADKLLSVGISDV